MQCFNKTTLLKCSLALKQLVLSYKFLPLSLYSLMWYQGLTSFSSHRFFFLFFFSPPSQAEEESAGWGPVLASLQVPELTMEDFLSESQSGGSFLTLYAFILQRLNTEYTAANERRTLAQINTWTNQVFPRFDLSSLCHFIASCGS